jgi:hypothetical protein
MKVDQTEFEAYIGKQYIDVYKELQELSAKYNLQMTPWPKDADIGADDTGIMCLIESDLDDKIVRFEYPPVE